MRACVMIEGQQGVTWRDLCALADACERLGFRGLFRSDHYFSARGGSGRGATDAWTLLGGLCARTSPIRLGRFWAPGTFRPPPPVILGGKAVGAWMQRLIGRYADEFNTVGGLPDEVAGRFARARAGFEAEGRDPSSLVTSLMTWFFVGRTEDEYLEKLHRAHAIDPDAGPFEDYRAEIERDCIVGASERASSRLREYAEAGVQRIFLNHELSTDLEMLEVVANEVLPQIDP